MNSLDFVNQISELVVEDNVTIYRDLFNNTDPNSATDQYWINALKFFNKLDEKDREMFFQILRQISVDTTSNILGILDGVSWLNNQDEEFVLTIGNSENPLNGMLQDIFLEQQEKNTN